MAANSLMAPFQDQGHVMVKVGCQRNHHFLSNYYQLSSKLGVLIAYGRPLN
jgi:hypothetical protein